MMSNTAKTLSGLIGLCVGDALGVPVEFTSSDELVKSPVTSMQGYDTWDVPAGTWSDDSEESADVEVCEDNDEEEDEDREFAVESFRRSWHEANKGQRIPLSQLWEGIETDAD